MHKVTLAFLRHAKVPSHEGDMQLTEDANADIEAAVPRLRDLACGDSRFIFLGTKTNRSRQTAEALRQAIDPDAPEVKPAWGLRNPDVYLAGSRVELGSKAEFFASQSELLDMTPDRVREQSFYQGFLTAPDRIEFWLFSKNPPGENAAAVAKRVFQFAQSFLAAPSENNLVVACVTHSPVMRAILMEGLGRPDTGEPDWVEEIVLEVTQSGMAFRFRDHIGTLPLLPQ